MKQTVDACVVAAFGRHLLVRTAGGERLPARPFGRALAAVCGDEVRCRMDSQHDELHVLEVLPRRNVLLRANARGVAEAVVANLGRLLVVVAPLPVPDLFVVDRYLAAGTAAGVPTSIVLNKSELAMPAALRAELAAYGAAGYPMLSCSAASGAGLQSLEAALPRGTRAALVGQSGVGKSSILRQLVPQAAVQIGGLMREAEGRHTTTAARLFELAHGAELIDAPGVRDFVPAVQALDARTLGFPEVAALGYGCRFADCEHVREPDCAVRAAAEAGEMSARRYESYRRLRRLSEQLAAARPPRRRR
jgi:ribosome biogenesis GTPase / thiamine phosphate phosphatase